MPDLLASQKFIASQANLPFSYPETFASQNDTPIACYDNDFAKQKIGHGEADFRSACEAIRQWQMFPRHWTKIVPENAPIEIGVTVAMCACYFGLVWGLPCRIVYKVESPGRFGFAYGTLPGHIEMGEELFLVTLEDDGSVFYEIKAFSRPQHWLAKVGYPIVRMLQAKFRRDSVAQMKSTTELLFG